MCSKIVSAVLSALLVMSVIPTPAFAQVQGGSPVEEQAQAQDKTQGEVQENSQGEAQENSQGEAQENSQGQDGLSESAQSSKSQESSTGEVFADEENKSDVAAAPSAAAPSAAPSAAQPSAAPSAAQPSAAQPSATPSTPTTISALAADPEVTATCDNFTATISAQGGDFDRASSVSFPAWSAKGGQDDLRWYPAAKSNGKWTLNIPITNHRTSGLYYVHAYGVINGALACIAAATFEVEAPTASLALTQTAAQKALDEATATLEMSNYAGKVSSVSLPTWTEAGGQDDLVWYGAASQDGGTTWTATIPTSGWNRGAGEYNTHAYVTLANGIFQYAAAVKQNLEVGSTATLTATVNADATVASIVGSGGAFSSATAVSYPTWSEAGGQDDLRWYPATKRNGAWVLNVPISNHRSVGKYFVHAYIAQRNAPTQFSATEFTIDKPTGTVVFSQTAEQIARDEATATFTLAAPSGTQAPKVTAVSFPTWTASGGQDDLVWYAGTKTPDAQEWTATFPTSGPRRGSGKYITHIYLALANGITVFGGLVEDDLVVGASENLSVELNATHTAFTVKASGGKFAQASSISFPTWSEAGGQDDIIWYAASKQMGQWVLNIPVTNHHTAGKYIVHAYGNVAGRSQFIKALTTTDEVEGPKPATVSATANSNGTISISVTDINSKPGIWAGSAPTWTSAGGQDDLVWHAASRRSATEWTSVIAAGEHNCEEGKYVTHVYLTAGNGVMAYVGAAEVSLALRNYVYVTGAYGSGWRTVWVKNPPSANVSVPTWSEAGGQDDIRWIAATHVGANRFRADVDCYNLKHSGIVLSHVYSGGSAIAGTSFSVSESEIAPWYVRANAGKIARLQNTIWSVPFQGNGYCAKWVNKVYAAAGFRYPDGNACDLYWKFCDNTDWSRLQPGMIIAVPKHTRSGAGRVYGHVAIYIGNGMVRHNSYVMKTESLSSWLSYYQTTYTAKFGWAFR